MNLQNKEKLLIKAEDRGLTQIDWLTSYHSFSFGDYYNPACKGFKTLRVINDDFIQAKKGFGTHPHSNMEILTYILEGAVEHKDTMGNSTIIQAGELQLMSAGSGIAHSEFNPLDQELHLLQIWIHCLDQNIEPSYQQKTLSEINSNNGIKLLCSKEGKAGSFIINQNIEIYEIDFNSSSANDFNELVKNKSFYLHNIDSIISINNLELNPGDGFGLESSNHEASNLEIKKSGKVLLFCFSD